MTDRIALILAAILVAGFALDHFVYHSAALLFIGSKLTGFIDYLEFWR